MILYKTFRKQVLSTLAATYSCIKYVLAIYLELLMQLDKSQKNRRVCRKWSTPGCKGSLVFRQETFLTRFSPWIKKQQAPTYKISSLPD